MTREEIEAFFAMRQQAWEQHDAARLAADYAEECVVASPFAGTIEGRAANERVYRSIFAAFPDLAFRSEELLIDGERAALFATVIGTHQGEFFGLAASGRKFEIRMGFLHRLYSRQIVQELRIYDFTGLLVQIGVLKAKPGKGTD